MSVYPEIVTALPLCLAASAMSLSVLFSVTTLLSNSNRHSAFESDTLFTVNEGTAFSPLTPDALELLAPFLPDVALVEDVFESVDVVAVFPAVEPCPPAG